MPISRCDTPMPAQPTNIKTRRPKWSTVPIASSVKAKLIAPVMTMLNMISLMP